MRLIIRAVAGALLALAAMPTEVHAGIAYPTNVAGTFADAAVNLQCDASGLNCQPVTAANPVPVNIVSGGGGAASENHIG